MQKRIVPLTPEKIAYARKRRDRLRAKLVGLTDKKAVRSTLTAIKRWEDILAGKPVY